MLKITESPQHIVLGLGCLAGKDFGHKISNISLVRKYFQQLPLDFQHSFTSAMQKGNYQSFGVPDVGIAWSGMLFLSHFASS